MQITVAVAFLCSYGWVRLGALGCWGVRLFYIITVITAVGVALGIGRHYNTYYVNIAWEWFLCVFSVCFWIGCKWIKKGGLCARALRQAQDDG
ncbi:hypothetical protein DPN68_12000 [Flavobacterium tibetense]|uniref:Uncharacterized protein n=1 Tax=Flavobacterium tibetense TaxID=2233533 RepID=A0A365NZ03_9FLAO|nr:hypothetical protein DPN68_12000 [Flavobacterium tibetense]